MNKKTDAQQQELLAAWQRLDAECRTQLLHRARELIELRRLGHRWPNEAKCLH